MRRADAGGYELSTELSTRGWDSDNIFSNSRSVGRKVGMGTSIPVSSLITCVRTSDRNWPTDMPRAEAASSSVYSAFPETHSTIPVTPSPSLSELLSILGFRGDLTQSGRVPIWDAVLPDFNMVLFYVQGLTGHARQESTVCQTVTTRACVTMAARIPPASLYAFPQNQPNAVVSATHFQFGKSPYQ